MKTIKDLAETIELSNEAFASMTKKEKKVQIAEDCLTRIELGQLEIDGGAFISFSTINRLKTTSNVSSLKNILNENIVTCIVCTKGGLFLSYVGRTNEFDTCNLTFSTSDGYNTLRDNEHKKLLEIFTPKELAYIEFAFEGVQHIDSYQNGNELEFTTTNYYRGLNFYKSYYSSKLRLIAICENIIKNKGTFKLGKEFDESFYR